MIKVGVVQLEKANQQIRLRLTRIIHLLRR